MPLGVPSPPSWPCGFDSRHPLHATSRDTVHRCLATSFTCPARRRGERPQPDSGLGDRPRRLGKRQRVQPPLKADRPAVLVAPAVPETELAQPPPGPLAVTHHIGPMTKSERGEPDASSWAPLTSWTRARIMGHRRWHRWGWRLGRRSRHSCRARQLPARRLTAVHRCGHSAANPRFRRCSRGGTSET